MIIFRDSKFFGLIILGFAAVELSLTITHLNLQSFISSDVMLLTDLSKNLKKTFIVVEQNISLISQLNSDCILVEKGILTKKLKSSEINTVEKARDLLSLHN